MGFRNLMKQTVGGPRVKVLGGFKMRRRLLFFSTRISEAVTACASGVESSRSNVEVTHTQDKDPRNKPQNHLQQPAEVRIALRYFMGH